MSTVGEVALADEVDRLRGQLAQRDATIAAVRAKCEEVARRGFDSAGLREVEAALSAPVEAGATAAVADAFVIALRLDDGSAAGLWNADVHHTLDAAREALADIVADGSTGRAIFRLVEADAPAEPTGDTEHVPLTFPFGEFLVDELAARGIQRRMLRRPLGLTVEEIDELIAGTRELTEGIAHRLGRFLGTSAELWLNLDRLHRAALAGSAPSQPAPTEGGDRG